MRRRLTLLVAATSCLTLIAFLVPLALLLRSVAADRATTRAVADLQGIVSVVGTADPELLRLTVQHLTSGTGRAVTVFLPDGSTLGTPSERTDAVELAATRRQSLTAEHNGGREIVIAVQGWSGGTTVIRGFVPASEVTAGVTRAWLVLAALGVALVVLGLLVADRLAQNLVRPITELSAVSRRLAGAELTARARPAGPPELREVAGALNHLADRIHVLLHEERERVADLSHRLRTPLTGLRLAAESVRDQADAARLTASVDAVERAVTGLIQQARWRSTPAGGGRADAAAVVHDRVAFWSVLAEDTGRTATVDLAEGPLPVAVSVDDLAAAVDALLGNVFAHTPDGTPFAVRLTGVPGRGGATLTISDSGPGMPSGLVHRGASAAGSTGLGLDIARRAARASGGRLDIATGERGGAVVTLRLGPAGPGRLDQAGLTRPA
jgi:signal transduction histidine kinase